MVLSNAQWFANPGVVYEIDESCRFNSADSAYTGAASPTPTSERIFTFSFWFKRAKLGTRMNIWSNERDDGAGTLGEIQFQADDTIRWKSESAAGANIFDRQTNAVFRDPSAWYHIVCVCDSNQTDATSAAIYVNGFVQTYSSTTNPGSAQDLGWPSTGQPFEVGKFITSAHYLDGYLSHFYFIDGQKLTPSYFGETNSTTGQWVPKAYTGTFGNAGLFLDFSVAPGTGDGAGTDSSGNDNDLTDSGLAAADQVVDTPTLNRAVLNGIQDGSSATAVMSEGNTRVAVSGSTRIQRMSTIPLVGKVYWEVAVADNSQNTAGICDNTVFPMEYNDFVDGLSPTHIMGFDNANLWYNSSYTTYSQPSDGQRWMFAFDADTGEFWSGVNGTWHNSGDPAAGSGEVGTVSTATTWFMFVGGKSGADQQLILGSGNMSHTVPSGFTADLDVSQLADPTIADPSAYFQPTIYTGNGSTQSIDQGGNSTFEPDFVWIKNRDATDSHVLTDSVRGATKILSSDTTAAETTDADTLTAFESNGFALGDDDKVNTNTEKYVAWQWLESATPGFDIVSYTGNATNRTISHSVGVAPEFMVVKNLADTDNWAVYHASNTSAPETDYLILNTDAATTDAATIWNDTAPTSSVFSVGTSSLTNGNTEAMIAYLWAGVEGFSKFGSYTGNNDANGPFVWCGFRPAFVLIKSTAAESWWIGDDKRPGYNDGNPPMLAPDTTAAEDAGWSGSAPFDIVSNGFKIRRTGDAFNGSGGTYLFAAFAETPFKTANAR